MAKQHVEDLNVSDVLPTSWQPQGLLPGASARMLATDPETGGFTAILELPENYRITQASKCDTEMQWLLLAGDVNSGTERLRAGAYCYYPAGATQPAWTVHRAALIFAIFGKLPTFQLMPNAPSDPRTIAHLDTWALDWVDPLKASDPSRPFRAGVMVKVLREDPVTGASTHLAGLMPGWYMPGMEVHPVYEENYCLSGDVHIGEVAGRPGYTMTVGSYLCRPPGVPHGPLVSKNGNVNLTYAHGRLGIEYRDNPRSMELIDKHLTAYRWN